MRGRVRVEPCPRRIRAFLDGTCVVDTTNASYVWEVPYYPAYYVPVGDVRADLVPTGETRRSPSRGDGVVFDVKTDRAVAAGAALRHPESPLEEIRELVRLSWDGDLEWFEEDEPVYTHARDPYKRVDVLASTRHVVVEVDGTVVAESRSPRILYETSLPPRFYLPMTDVRLDLLEATTTQSHCPYKGTATYWTLVLDGKRYEDFVWCYRAPFPESQKIAGMVCFYNEKVDLIVDGTRLERPHTKFS
jgi:uncharacterized protein (DUF427 family)